MINTKELYNPDVKERYIKLKLKEAKEHNVKEKDPLMNRYDGRVFCLSCKIEDYYKKDLCHFSKDNIKDMYTSLRTPSINYLMHLNGLYKQYADWAIQEGITSDPINHFGEMELINFGECINQRSIEKSRITRLMLNEWAKGTGYFESRNLCDLAAVFLLFEGIRGEHYKDLLELTFDDVNYDKHTVKVRNGSVVMISKECAEVLRNASKDEEYYLPNGKPMPFLDNKIIRSYRKDQLSEDRGTITKVNTLKKRISKFLEIMEIYDVNLGGIYSWGVVDYVTGLIKKNSVKETDIPTFLNREGKREVCKRFRITNFDPKRFYEKYKNYLVEPS